MPRKKRVQVVTRDCNGEDIVLMRKRRSFKTLWLWSSWEDWKLENEQKYAVSEKLHSLVKQAEMLLKAYDDECKYIKNLKKEVAADTRATRGFSAPYYIEVPAKELSWKFHKHRSNPGEGWRSMFAREFLRKCGMDSRGAGGSNKQTTREKVGAPPVDPGHQTRYMPEGLSVKFENDEFDSEIIYKEPNKGQQQQRNRKNNNRNNNNNNGGHEYN